MYMNEQQHLAMKNEEESKKYRF